MNRFLDVLAIVLWFIAALWILLVIATSDSEANDTLYMRFQLGPWWDTCTSNSCGIEYGSRSDSGLQSEFEIGRNWSYKDWSIDLGPSLNVGYIPLHGRNVTKELHRSADGEYLITNSILLNSRLGYQIEGILPYIEASVGMATFVTTFGGQDYAPMARVGLGIEVPVLENTSVTLSGRYQRSSSFDIGPYHSSGLDGYSTQLGLVYRF